MKRLGRWVLFAVALAAPLCACEAVVGDLGSYTDSCNPADDRCPKSAACSFDFKLRVFKCVPRKGSKGEDNPCDEEADCVGGLTCATFKNNTTGHCARYCQKPSDCPTAACYDFDPKRLVPGSESAGACGPLVTPCDPLAATSPCGTGRVCIVFDTDYTKCIGISPMPVKVGQMCPYLNDCPQGSLCVGSPDAGYTCVELCDFDSPSCPGMAMCEDLPGGPITVGSTHIGLCN